MPRNLRHTLQHMQVKQGLDIVLRCSSEAKHDGVIIICFHIRDDLSGRTRTQRSCTCYRMRPHELIRCLALAWRHECSPDISTPLLL